MLNNLCPISFAQSHCNGRRLEESGPRPDRCAIRIEVLCACIAATALNFSTASALAGGCDGWLAGPLNNQTEGIESDQVVDGSTIWTPPSGGPTMLVVGGSFTTAGGAPTNFLAGWDGASWRDLGGGVNDPVWTVAVFSGDLIVGGSFTAAGTGGSVPAINIARYDGSAWHAMGEGLHGAPSGAPPFCAALCVYNGDLIAGGRFQIAGNQTATNIARWNGTTWSALGNGVGAAGSPDDSVRALRVHINNLLYVGGEFDVAGGVSAANIVQFNGSTYSALGSGTSGPVSGEVDALHSFGNDVVVGGRFNTAGGLSAPRAARWTPGGEFGGFWGTLGTGPPGPATGFGGVFAFQPFNGLLIAGGQIATGIHAWNPANSTWTTLGGGMTGGLSNLPRAFTLNVFDGNLIAAGTFNTAGGVTATSIAQRSISPPAWSALQAPVPQVLAFDTLGSRFYAAGSFLQSTTSQTPAHNIISWNGSTLTRVQNNICCGEGTNGIIRALKSSGTNELVVGGDFTVAGGVTANRIAKWKDDLFNGGWSALGDGFNAPVLALERLAANQFFGDTIFAGGEFTAAGDGSPAFNRIASWSGSPAQWFTLGTGFNNRVRALKGFNSGPIARFLYAGGDFTTASGISANHIAFYPIPNQNGWVAMGSGFNAPVNAIERHNGNIYAAGEFTASGATPISHVARWTGTTWESVSGGTNGVVSALKSDGTNLYAIGGFTVAGGIAVNRVARWNSVEGWSDVDGGTNDVVNALGFYRGEVHVGLGITLGLADDGSEEGAGGQEAAPQPGKGWVRYSPTGAPWLSSNPIGQTVTCFNTASFTAQPAQGFSLLIATWHKNGVALNDGPTGHGSTISGAHAGTLTISSARTFDAGSYTCSFSNLCGSVTSNAATLNVNTCCDPDFNNDFGVDIDDLLMCINGWGICPAPPSMCLPDIAPPGSNGSVDIDDLLRVISGWGACP